MNYRLLVIPVLAVSLRAIAAEEPLAPPIVDKSSGPAVTIDNWMPKSDPKPPPVVLPVPEVPPPSVRKTAATAPPPPPTKKKPKHRETAPAASVPVVAPPPPRVSMNEMTGTISEIDADAKTIRVTVDGGISPQFDFNDQTVVVGGLKLSDLDRGDRVTVRYVGKDLVAREIERLKKGPR